MVKYSASNSKNMRENIYGISLGSKQNFFFTLKSQFEFEKGCKREVSYKYINLIEKKE